MAAKIKNNYFIIVYVFLLLSLHTNCKRTETTVNAENQYKIIFLHHSTGEAVWNGGDKGSGFIQNLFGKTLATPEWFKKYNKKNVTNYLISEEAFPKEQPYGWENYPYDYYNIWVKNAGENPYREEPTLEILTQEYKLIIFKHCFPAGYIEEDKGEAVLDSKIKSLENYKAQYEALKEKMHRFPENKFLVWTAPALVEAKTNPDYAVRTKEFVDWVKNEWDVQDDNIFIWDFYGLETEGGIYLPVKNARNAGNSHLSGEFAAKVSPLFCQRIADVIETNGQKTTLTGEYIK